MLFTIQRKKMGLRTSGSPNNIANSNWLSILISSWGNPTMGTLVKENITTIPAVMLDRRKWRLRNTKQAYQMYKSIERQKQRKRCVPCEQKHQNLFHKMHIFSPLHQERLEIRPWQSWKNINNNFCIHPHNLFRQNLFPSLHILSCSLSQFLQTNKQPFPHTYSYLFYYKLGALRRSTNESDYCQC